MSFYLLMAAEKVTSLGKDWHRPCLRCERCSKTLAAGSHAEVRGNKGCRDAFINSVHVKEVHQVEILNKPQGICGSLGNKSSIKVLIYNSQFFFPFGSKAVQLIEIKMKSQYDLV